MTSTALTDEWAPGVIAPGARPFENMPDDLELMGVHFAPEQLSLLEVGSVFRPGWYDRLLALTMVPLADPEIPHAEATGIHCLTSDEHLNLDPVLVPAVAEIDCSLWEQYDMDEPHWRRFPSLLGRVHVWSPTTGTIQESLAPLRLWSLWPLSDRSDLDLVANATSNWVEENWVPFKKWIEVRDNADVFACDYEGTPEHLHDHGVDEAGWLLTCRQSDAWFQHYMRTELVELEDGITVQDRYLHRPFPPVGGLHHLGPVWDHLLNFSRYATHQAISGYPAWEQEDVLRTERHYSPWLWSC